MLKVAELSAFSRTVYIVYPLPFTLRRLSRYLSGVWRRGWRGALRFGSRLGAVDHDAIRVWHGTSVKNEPYLSALPVIWLLEGAPYSPAEALHEGCSRRGSGRQLRRKKQKKKEVIREHN